MAEDDEIRVIECPHEAALEAEGHDTPGRDRGEGGGEFTQPALMPVDHPDRMTGGPDHRSAGKAQAAFSVVIACDGDDRGDLAEAPECSPQNDVPRVDDQVHP